MTPDVRKKVKRIKIHTMIGSLVVLIALILAVADLLWAWSNGNIHKSSDLTLISGTLAIIGFLFIFQSLYLGNILFIELIDDEQT